VSPPDEPWPEGKRRIVEAAIRVIGEEGVHQLTHRRAAAVAGLSLASTTYFFVNKAEIVFEAFRELHRRTVDQFLTMRTPPPKGLSELLLNADGSMRWDFGAMRALYVSAARDPSLRVLAASLRKDQGYGGERWLTALGIKDVDRLDGRLWSFVISGLVDEAMLQPPVRRAAFLDAVGERAFGDLFESSPAEPG
jgi:DNA-binding transcriptional regulator YbjK